MRPENVASPFPRRIEICAGFWIATARSISPSPLKSPARTSLGCPPRTTDNAFWNVPFPLPGRMEMLLEPSLATARSIVPLPS